MWREGGSRRKLHHKPPPDVRLLVKATRPRQGLSPRRRITNDQRRQSPRRRRCVQLDGQNVGNLWVPLTKIDGSRRQISGWCSLVNFGSALDLDLPTEETLGSSRFVHLNDDPAIIFMGCGTLQSSTHRFQFKRHSRIDGRKHTGCRLLRHIGQHLTS